MAAISAKSLSLSFAGSLWRRLFLFLNARRKTHSASRGCVLYNLGNFAADFISHDGGLACYDYDIVLIIIIQTSLQVHSAALLLAAEEFWQALFARRLHRRTHTNTKLIFLSLMNFSGLLFGRVLDRQSDDRRCFCLQTACDGCKKLSSCHATSAGAPEAQIWWASKRLMHTNCVIRFW